MQSVGPGEADHGHQDGIVDPVGVHQAGHHASASASVVDLQETGAFACFLEAQIAQAYMPSVAGEVACSEVLRTAVEVGTVRQALRKRTHPNRQFGPAGRLSARAAKRLQVLVGKHRAGFLGPVMIARWGSHID